MKLFSATAMKLPFNTYGLILASALAVAGKASAVITMDTVLVGNAGNASDSLTGRGAVAYEYGIGKYEVTLSQYNAFLNAVAVTDTYGLYSSFMSSQVQTAGILQAGISGSYTYSVIGSGNRPVTYVSWFDAARFSNWMHNGQPAGSQNTSTTEDGAYTLNGALTGVGFTRNANARYGLPTEDEWYKAAYHQPASLGGDSDNYWLYPTTSNTKPSNTGSLSDPNRANFDQTPSATSWLTDVGSFSLSSSYYGTFDQAGNLQEWTDGVLYGGRIARGGSYDFTAGRGYMESTSGYVEGSGDRTVGFRLVVVPEPTMISLMALGGIIFAAQRRQKV